MISFSCLKQIYENHCKKNLGATFLCGEVTYSFGSIGVRNNKIIDFKGFLQFVEDSAHYLAEDLMVSFSFRDSNGSRNLKNIDLRIDLDKTGGPDLI